MATLKALKLDTFRFCATSLVILLSLYTMWSFIVKKKKISRTIAINHDKFSRWKLGRMLNWRLSFARYGVQLILEDRPKDVKEYTPAVLVIVFFGVLAGAQNMGLTSPHLEAFAVARGSAAAIFQVLDRVPTIDSLSKDGQKLPSVNGEIEFKNVHFQYPARKDVKVLQGLNLKINRGETVALVGGSGCGKSTCLQLIQRLYDPHKGQASKKKNLCLREKQNGGRESLDQTTV